jgi:hypothetical protein
MTFEVELFGLSGLKLIMQQSEMVRRLTSLAR